MQLTPLLTKARTLRNFYHVGDYGAARAMTEAGLNQHQCSFDPGTETYWIRDLDLYFPPAHHNLLGHLWLVAALKEAGVSLTNCGAEIVADTGAFNVALGTLEEFILLYEIFAQGVYNVVPCRQSSIVLDIGMNVGLASLYFAAQPWVEAVWSYEPVPETYARAVRNLERNPALAAKIVPHNFGLSDVAGKMTFDYCSQWAAAVGVSGLNAEFRRSHEIAASDISTVTVDVQDVCAVIRDVRARYTQTQVMVKIDCEGAEYAMMAALGSAGLLREVEAFLIEWHERGPRELEETLTRAGFFVVSLKPRAAATGMLYAHRATEGAKSL